MPNFSVISLSDTLPPQHDERKEIVPCGVIPITILTVKWCLQLLHTCALTSKSVGLSIKISMQSIITQHFLKNFQKLIGIVARKISLSGHFIRGAVLTASMTSTR